ncbi:MAG: peptidoglycan DD-metalloendopeptidase family protein [Hyphomicrobiales bacterium]
MSRLRPAVLVLLLVQTGPALAEDVAPDPKQLESVEQQLEGSKAAQERIAAEVAAAQREQDEIASRLIEISSQIQDQEAAIAASEAELKRLAEEQVVLMADLGERREVLSELLAGLQRLEQNPPPALVVKPDDVLAALRGAMLFGTVVPQLQDDARTLAKELARLDAVKAEIAARKQTLSADMARLETARSEIDGLIAQKRALISRGNADLDAERKRADALAANARSLRQLLDGLAAARKAAEAEAARAAADAAEAARLEAEKRQPRIAFTETKGQLALPATGRILRRYGDPDGLGGTSQGLVIATRKGAQVTAPADGEVEFAGPFRSYGKVVILNPGSGYRILLAGLDELTAVTGERLRAGEPVGVMGDGPSSVTLLGELVQNGEPVLYIEFRNSTEAIDSGPWWTAASKEARG